MKILGRIPTVPEYYQEFINNSINLLDSPKQCCPFHEEKTPSFSYNIETGRWSCFGSCHAHGDVIDMHQRWYKIESRQEAERSLRSMYQVEAPKSLDELASGIVAVSPENVENETTYITACSLANTPERWVELDYVMSQTPYERYNLLELIYKWKEEQNGLS